MRCAEDPPEFGAGGSLSPLHRPRPERSRRFRGGLPLSKPRATAALEGREEEEEGAGPETVTRWASGTRRRWAG